jgi:hypothetical protein
MFAHQGFGAGALAGLDGVDDTSMLVLGDGQDGSRPRTITLFKLDPYLVTRPFPAAVQMSDGRLGLSVDLGRHSQTRLAVASPIGWT